MNETSEVKIRRAPKLPVFLVIGALIGALVTLIVTSLFRPDPAVGFAASAGYFLLFGIPAGIAVGAAVALIIDRVSVARARTITVEHEVVESTPAKVTKPAAKKPTTKKPATKKPATKKPTAPKKA